MAPRKGNKNALGNESRKNLDIKRVAKFKGLILDHVIGIMEGDNKKLKDQLAIKSIGYVLPRPIEEGESGKTTVNVNIVKYGDNATAQIQAKVLPAQHAESNGSEHKARSDSVA